MFLCLLLLKPQLILPPCFVLLRFFQAEYLGILCQLLAKGFQGTALLSDVAIAACTKCKAQSLLAFVWR